MEDLSEPFYIAGKVWKRAIDFSTAKMLIVREICVTAKENQQRYENLEKKNYDHNKVLIFLRKKKC